MTEEERELKRKTIFDSLVFSIKQSAEADGIKMDDLYEELKANKNLYNLMMYFTGFMCDLHAETIKRLLPEEIVELYLQSIQNPIGEFKEKP